MEAQRGASGEGGGGAESKPAAIRVVLLQTLSGALWSLQFPMGQQMKNP